MSALTHRKNLLITAQTLRKSRNKVHVRKVRHLWARSGAALAMSCGALAVTFWEMPLAGAAQAPVNLGTASSYAVLAGSTVTNTGSSVIAGDIGLSPGTAVTGFPPGLQNAGVMHVADAPAVNAQSDLTAAYLDVASRTPVNTVSADLGGSTLVPGVYQSTSGLSLTGTLTLNGGGDPAAVFIFQAGSTLTAAGASQVVLENGAQACHVFWQVGSSATIGTTSQFNGVVLALTSITLNTGATVGGQLLARNGTVTLDSNVITVPTCSAAAPTTPTTVAATPTTTVTPTTLAPTTSTTVAKKAKKATKPTSTTTRPPSTTTTRPPSTTTTTPVPTGPPATGFGGTAGPGGSPRTPLILGSLGLATFFGGLAWRERRRDRRVRSSGFPDQPPRT